MNLVVKTTLTVIKYNKLYRTYIKELGIILKHIIIHLDY